MKKNIIIAIETTLIMLLVIMNVDLRNKPAKEVQIPIFYDVPKIEVKVKKDDGIKSYNDYANEYDDFADDYNSYFE